jgi:CHAT domain-containing protein
LEPPERKLLEAFVTLLQGLTSTHRGMDKAVEKLGESLLPKACREFIAGKERLILSPHRSLHLFPFHASRWEDGSFLVEHFTVRYVPNLGSLLLPWSGEDGTGLLAIGIRNFKVPGKSLGELQRAEEEAQMVRDIHAAQGAADMLLGQRASRVALAALRTDGRLSRYRCVHLATHGTSVFQESAVEEPLDTRIYLHDGALDGIDIANLGLKADLVVMSACHSGQRALGGQGLSALPADDIFGLQATLFQSGVRSVLGALWPVHNPAAFIIQPAFHRAYAAGATVDRALQTAIRTYLADSPADQRGVFYWAPFFITSMGRMDEVRRSHQGVRTCQN